MSPLKRIRSSLRLGTTGVLCATHPDLALAISELERDLNQIFDEN